MNTRNLFRPSLIFVMKVLFVPVVLTGPSGPTEASQHATVISFDTQNRRLFLVRPEQMHSEFNNSFLPSDVKRQNDEWWKLA